MENRYSDLNITALPVSTTHNDTLVSNDAASTTTSLTIQNGTVSTQTNYSNSNNHAANNNNSNHLNNNHISSNGTAGRLKATDDQTTPNNLVIDEQNSSG